jgi:putative copper resistance protein D
MASGSATRLRWVVEAELGIAVTVLLAAASLASAPPAIDVVEHRVAPGDVAARFAPRWPRLTSPSIDQLLAVATPISNVEAPRQPEEYAWSEYNHHTAGLFVLAMGLLACLDYTRRARWARHWPLLLLGLAAFMFVRNDPEVWPVGPLGFWETLLLPEVLQHRLAVALAVGLGLFEWLVRTDRVASPGLRLVFPLLCAVASTLLLVHSHAIANVRTVFFTEVSHASLGILGVVLAWGRWLELRLPALTRGCPAACGGSP